MHTRIYAFGNGDKAIVEIDEKIPGTKKDVKNGQYPTWSVRFYEATSKGARHVGGYCTITQMPGCCGASISSDLMVHGNYRGTQYPPTWRKLLFDILREDLKFAILLATWEDTNIAQIRSAKDLGWSVLDTFINKKTFHKLQLGVKHL